MKLRAIACLLAGAPILASAQMENPGFTNDADIFVEWTYSTNISGGLLGLGNIYLENVGAQDLNEFYIRVDDLTSLTDPGGWSHEYDGELVPEEPFTLQRSTNLAESTWTTVTNILQESAETNWPVPPGEDRGFYRVKLPADPP